MEILFLEDPACGWCWAFQPVQTAFLFEYGERIPWRIALGGLREQPVPDPELCKRHWELAAEISGMPFHTGQWDLHQVATTSVASRVVKAVHLKSPETARRYLRRIQEAFHVDCLAIDDLETLFELAGDVDLDTAEILEQLANGRAAACFELDRNEAAQHGFGFPTVLLRRTSLEAPRVLSGNVSYDELTEALEETFREPIRRRRFGNTASDWQRLFRIHSRVTTAEIAQLTGWSSERIEAELAKRGFVLQGAFWSRPRTVAVDARLAVGAPPGL